MNKFTAVHNLRQVIHHILDLKCIGKARENQLYQRATVIIFDKNSILYLVTGSCVARQRLRF